MDSLKKYTDVTIILIILITSTLWINSRFNDLEKDIENQNDHLSYLQNDCEVIKTVLIYNLTVTDKDKDNILTLIKQEGNE